MLVAIYVSTASSSSSPSRFSKWNCARYFARCDDEGEDYDDHHQMMQVSMLMIIAVIIMMAMMMMRMVQMTSIQFEYRQVSEEMLIQAFTRNKNKQFALQQEIMLTGLQYSRQETPLPCLALLWRAALGNHFLSG